MHQQVFLDTNILLQILLGRAGWEDAYQILKTSEVCHMTEHALSSIFLKIEKMHAGQSLFEVGKLFENYNIRFHSLIPYEGQVVFAIAKRDGLCFEDALQLVFARRLQIPFITLDTDFDHLKKDYEIYSPKEWLAKSRKSKVRNKRVI